ncbi:MAG: glycosyltransferase family 4 protein [Acidimicrobiales bacterium]
MTDTQLLRDRDELDELVEQSRRHGLRRVRLLAWRDLDDPEAGGSELHAHHIASMWAEAGLDVTLRTSAVPGASEVVRRAGYRAIRRNGRYSVFPSGALESAAARTTDALVEIWNGMPFFSPLWWRGTRMVFLHHVHAEMWHMTLPPVLARVGEQVERRLAPALYRRSRIVTLSDSSRREIEQQLGLSRVDVVAPGVDPVFSPAPGRAAVPTVLAVGRLVPVKRFPLLVQVLSAVRARVPELQAVVVGEGYARAEVEDAIAACGAEDWLTLRGHSSQGELRDLYRRAWVLASTSLREGWGMSITEAAACGTPAVATRIAGHSDSVVDGTSGMLVDTMSAMADALVAVLTDELLRERLRRGALAQAEKLSWETTASGALRVLLDEHRRRPRHR